MSDLPADPPSAWNATERSRAQTRGLLSALARDRTRSLATPIWKGLLNGTMTLGVGPLVGTFQRWPRWERMEWRQFEEFAGWTKQHVLLRAPAAALETLAEWGPIPRSKVILAAVICAMNAIWAIFYILSDSTPSGRQLAPWPFEFSRWWRVALIVVACCWLQRAFFLARHVGRRTFWLFHANQMLQVDEKRPIAHQTMSGWNWVAGFVGLVIFCWQTQTNWPVVAAPIVFVMYLGNVYIRDSRRINLQLIERLLEWMDDTGLPVEYDVTALNPDEIAAMMR